MAAATVSSANATASYSCNDDVVTINNNGYVAPIDCSNGPDDKNCRTTAKAVAVVAPMPTDQTATNSSEVVIVDRPPMAAVSQKSATLTPGNNNSKSESVNSTNAITNHARNNLRRSFTLPRNLLSSKKPAGISSENGNDSIIRNFLTLVRTKSIRRPKLTPETVAMNGHDGMNGDISNHLSFPPGFTPGAIGLKNQGNTCFMNAIVQCLSHTDSLAKYLVMDRYKSDLRKKYWIKSGKGEVTEEFAGILKSTWLRQNLNVLEEVATRFKTAVEKGASQWRGSEQQDAQEFLLWLLDRLHEDLNLASSNKYKPVKSNIGRPDEQVAAEALENHTRCNNSIIQDIFGAQFRSSLTCPGCERQSATFDPFLCVSLPIPQAKQECAVYVNIVYLSQQPRLVKLGLSVSASADVKELKQLLSADTSIEENDILLAEIDGEGFHRTFTETQLVSVLTNNEALYCIEAPQLRETNESDGAFLMVTWANILVTNEGNTRVRFGSPYVTQIARETGIVDLQKILLKEMAGSLQPGILVAEQKDPVFSIRVLDGSAEGSLVDPLVEHPLYMESVDHALSLCDEDVPPHIKIHLEWTPESKDKIIAEDAENVEEHSSVAQTRQKHSEETVDTVTLGECFDLYTKAEQLSAEDSWHCPNCNRKEQGTLKMIGLWTAPQVLVVHLKRFRHTAKGRHSATKLSSVVEFPVEGLDLAPHVTKRLNRTETNGIVNPASSPMNGCFGLSSWKTRASFKKNLATTNHRVTTANYTNHSEEPHPGLIYDLYAVCNHHGKDLLGGHYTACCKNPVDGTWWSFDDTKVTELSSPIESKTASAYILFYQRRSQNHLQSQQPHWCRPLVRKHHKMIMSNSNSTNLAPKKQETALTNGTAPIENGYHSGSDTNTKTSSSLSKSSSSGSSSAPLARMEDIAMTIGLGLPKEVQIESTV